MGLPEEFIPFARPSIGADEKAAVLRVLDSGWLTTGAEALAFEQEFCQYVGGGGALAVNSCTAALHLALDDIGLQKGDLVITTPFTFAATAEVIRYFDADPLFVDIDPRTLNIAPEKIAQALEQDADQRRIKAIMPVHYAGLACEMTAIMELAARWQLPVISDAAHALPTQHQGRMIGSIADYTCFSFYVTKTITTGEGGMLVCRDSERVARLRSKSLHGISKDAWQRYAQAGNWYYQIESAGYKYNMSDLAAAMGRVQLARADQLWQARVQIASYYNDSFGGCDALILPPQAASRGQHSWHLYVLRLVPELCGASRNRFIAELKELGIGASVHFIPLHTHPYYQQRYALSAADYPDTMQVYNNILSLPIYPGLSKKQQARIVQAVLQLLERYQVVAAVKS